MELFSEETMKTADPSAILEDLVTLYALKYRSQNFNQATAVLREDLRNIKSSLPSLRFRKVASIA